MGGAVDMAAMEAQSQALMAQQMAVQMEQQRENSQQAIFSTMQTGENTRLGMQAEATKSAAQVRN